MPTITGIHTIEGGRAGRPAAGDRGGTDRLVLLDNGRRLRVDVEQVVLHGLAPGGVIEPSLVARLAAQEAYLRARERALRLLAIRPRSVEELRARLVQHRIPRNTLGTVIAELEAQGYLDDLAFARSWIAARAGSRAYGIGRLRLELRRKGVPAAVVDQAVQEASAADPDLGAAEERSALALVERRLPAYRRLTPEQRARRLAALLSRRGFARSTVVRALRTIGGTKQVEAFDEN
jgi:regulatory protein